MPNVYEREKTPADLLLDELTAVRLRAENHMNGLAAILGGFVEHKRCDADANRDGETPVFTEEEWTITDGWIDRLINGYDITDAEGNVIGHQIGLDELKAAALAAKGDQEPHPLPEPEPEPEPAP